MSTFLLKRGKRAVKFKARAHLARFDAHGRIAGAWCGRAGFDLSSNVPWGLKICKQCAQRSAS